MTSATCPPNVIRRSGKDVKEPKISVDFQTKRSRYIRSWNDGSGVWTLSNAESLFSARRTALFEVWTIVTNYVGIARNLSILAEVRWLSDDKKAGF